MVEIKESVIAQLKTFCQVYGNEVGGVLTGSIISDNIYRISNVSDPCAVIELSSRCRFVRDAGKANDFIKSDFKGSEHTRVYVGEWHTHPEDNPQPSSVDIKSVREIYKKSDIVLNGVFLIIVGLKSNYYGFYDGKSMIEINVTIV
jgi:hypothetical protein bacD2_22117